MDLKGKRAIITGSNSGIGLGVAEELARAGAEIVLNSFTDREEDHALAAKIAREHGVTARYIKADMSRGDECRALVEQAGDPDFCEFDNIGGCKPVTRGCIWFPKVNGQPTAGPIVVLCHGVPPGNQCQSTFYKGFERLLKCIAANGMIAISIECLVADNAIGRANRIIAQLQRIKSVIKSKGVILTGNETLALVGHSNGGEAVPFAADAVRTGAVKSQFTSVKTVVQLAPSVPNFKLVNQYAQNQLVIQGGLDGNVLPEGGVDHYEQFFGVTMVEKKAMPGTFQSLVFLHGGSHTGLSDIEYNNSCGALSYEGDPSTKKEIVSMLRSAKTGLICRAKSTGCSSAAGKEDTAARNPARTG